jgi:heme/copper-type cytochrome/quinol oxidase subunit 3/cytochrome c5
MQKPIAGPVSSQVLDAEGTPRRHRPAASASTAAATVPGPALPAGWFVFLAVEGALLAALLSIHVIALEGYPHWTPAATLAATSSWTLLQAAVLVLAGVSVVLAVHCARRGQRGWRDQAMVLLAATMMYGIVFLGTLAGGLVSAADVRQALAGELHAAFRALAPTPAATSTPLATTDPAADPAADAAARARGDALRGARAYRASCAGCHGREGEGVTNLGLPLVGTPFMRQADDQALRAVIVDGRQPGDSASQMGQLMPPRGGNPFLRDEQIDDIIAFLRQLNGGDADASESAPAASGPIPDATDNGADLDHLVPRWVVPPAAKGPDGLATPWQAADERASPAALASPATATAATAPARGPDWILFAIVAMLGVHVMIAMVIAARLLMYVWTSRRDRAAAALSRAARAYWLAAAIAWIVLLPLLYYRP